MSEAIYILIGVGVRGLLSMAGLSWIEYRRDRHVAHGWMSPDRKRTDQLHPTQARLVITS
jgi:hypothetical protein